MAGTEPDPTSDILGVPPKLRDCRCRMYSLRASQRLNDSLRLMAELKEPPLASPPVKPAAPGSTRVAGAETLVDLVRSSGEGAVWPRLSARTPFDGLPVTLLSPLDRRLSACCCCCCNRC